MAERADPNIPEFFEGSIWRKRFFDRYNFCKEIIEGKVVLDIPCGIGWGTSLLKSSKKSYGVDISKKAILRAVNDYHGIDFIIGDMASIPFKDNIFNALLCLEGYEHISQENQLKFIKESKRVLNKDGIIIITTPLLNSKRQSSGNRFHLNEPSLNDIKIILLDNFNVVSFEITGNEFKTLRFVGKNK